MYPADVLALGSRGEGFGADDGISPDEGVLLRDIQTALLWPNDRAVMRQQTIHTGLLVYLDTEHTRVVIRGLTVTMSCQM